MLSNDFFESITYEDLKQARFAKNNLYIYIKKAIFRFPSVSSCSSFWLDITQDLMSLDAGSSNQAILWLQDLCRIHDADISYATEEDYKETEDIPCHFRKAIDQVVYSGNHSFDNHMPVTATIDNVFILNALAMKESLYNAFEDCGFDADDDALFQHYMYQLSSLIWYADLYGEECLTSLLRNFFDNYLQVLRN